MLIIEIWGISFHAVVVFGLGKNLLFDSILGLCELDLTRERPSSYFFPEKTYVIRINTTWVES